MNRTRPRSALARQVTGVLNRRVLGPMLAYLQNARRDQFEATGVPPRQIVLIGDRLTEAGNWDEWFPGRPVLNRGNGGDHTAEVLARLDSAVHDPLGVLLLIGTNDISAAVAPGETLANLRAILREIERLAPDAPVVVQSVLPRSRSYAREVRELNRGYQEVVAEAAKRVTYLDLWPALGADDGSLRKELTPDQVHLNGQGYREWVTLIRPIIDEWSRSR
ncbi:GDSL-type esterase/lipase family protein [Amycolatopsis sp. NBC_00345]|uniref:GDSL-type esterase/lipase family protein n=1 Tax=Amycolatopsis sp. NBC_00345 TaxID=2975955 RepID=UPI002E259C63